MYTTECQKQSPIRQSMRGGADGEFSMRGLTKDEQDSMEAMLSGGAWVRVNAEGRLERIERFAAMPDPADDPHVGPHWDKPSEASVKLGCTIRPGHDEINGHSPSIYIQHVGWHSSSGYEYCARELERWGFECLRSRRHKNNQFWEVWFLFGLCGAREELRDAIGEKGIFDKEGLRRAVEFLRKWGRFATLDVVVQRLAAMSPD